MKIRKFSKEIEASTVSMSVYVSYLNLQHYESEYDAHKCLLQLVQKIYTSIKDNCIFKIDKFESTLCNDCGHITSNNGVCIDWSLHLVNSSNVQTIRGMLHQLMDPRGEYLEKMCRWMLKDKYINKGSICPTVI